jgi:hypothetical protein
MLYHIFWLKDLLVLNSVWFCFKIVISVDSIWKVVNASMQFC